MVTVNQYKEIIKKLSNQIADAIGHDSIYLQENQIDALQTRAAWDVACIMRNGLEDALGIELSLNLVWDSWIDYHRNKYGTMTAELLQQMHDYKYAEYVTALDPRDIENVTDPMSHYYAFVMGYYQSTKVVIHSVQSDQQQYMIRHLFDVQRTLAHDNMLDVPTDVVLAYEDALSIIPDLSELIIGDDENDY